MSDDSATHASRGGIERAPLADDTALMVEETQMPKRALFGLSAAVYVQRDGKILVLKRAMGEATGGWYIPGGAVDPGEDVETLRRDAFGR